MSKNHDNDDEIRGTGNLRYSIHVAPNGTSYAIDDNGNIIHKNVAIQLGEAVATAPHAYWTTPGFKRLEQIAHENVEQKRQEEEMMKQRGTISETPSENKNYFHWASLNAAMGSPNTMNLTEYGVKSNPYQAQLQEEYGSSAPIKSFRDALTNSLLDVGLNKVIQYGKGIFGRIKDLKANYATSEDIIRNLNSNSQIISKPYPDLSPTATSYASKTAPFMSYPLREAPEHIRLHAPEGANRYTNAGSVVLTDPSVSPNTIQFHQNPYVFNKYNENGYWVKSLGSYPSSQTVRSGKTLAESFPENTITAQGFSEPTALYIQRNPSFFNRMNYVLTGKYAPKIKKTGIDGYSTDVFPEMVRLEKRGKGVIRQSANTYATGTNMYGKSFKDLEAYFGKPNKNGEVLFKDMSPSQVKAWNNEQASTYGFHINPKTRTAPTNTFIYNSSLNPTYAINQSLYPFSWSRPLINLFNNGNTTR